MIQGGVLRRSRLPGPDFCVVPRVRHQNITRHHILVEPGKLILALSPTGPHRQEKICEPLNAPSEKSSECRPSSLHLGYF